MIKWVSILFKRKRLNNYKNYYSYSLINQNITIDLQVRLWIVFNTNFFSNLMLIYKK